MTSPIGYRETEISRTKDIPKIPNLWVGGLYIALSTRCLCLAAVNRVHPFADQLIINSFDFSVREAFQKASYLQSAHWVFGTRALHRQRSSGNDRAPLVPPTEDKFVNWLLRKFRRLAENSGQPDIVVGVVAGMIAWLVTSSLRYIFD